MNQDAMIEKHPQHLSLVQEDVGNTRNRLFLVLCGVRPTEFINAERPPLMSSIGQVAFGSFALFSKYSCELSCISRLMEMLFVNSL